MTSLDVKKITSDWADATWASVHKHVTPCVRRIQPRNPVGGGTHPVLTPATGLSRASAPTKVEAGRRLHRGDLGRTTREPLLST